MADERRKETIKRLQEAIPQLEQNVGKAEELSRVENELAALNPDRFACKTTEELRTLQDTRRKLIQRIMGSG